MPKANVGRLEWKLRVAGGIVLLAAAFFIEWPQAWEGLIGVIGGALLVTGLVRYCPLNHLFGRTPPT
jgi:predicted anti-sigma-YlaC factor YlaD